MKKIYSLITLLAAAAGFVGCADNDDVVNNAQPDTTPEMVEVRAYTSSATRTTLDSEYNVLWTATDRIMIGDEVFDLVFGGETTSAVFTGSNRIADGEYPVYYPSTYKGATWPDQKYGGPNGIFGAPMKATAKVTNGEISALHFKNLGGIIRYTVKGSKTIKSINVKGNGLDITLDCGDGVDLTATGTEFNIALPEGSYSNAKLTFLATDGTMATKTASTFKVTKNKVSLATFEASSLTFEHSAYSPAGTTAVIYGRDAVVVDLGGDIGKVAIAARNEQIMEEDIFDYDDIVNKDLFKEDGWYVPSAHELELFSKLFAEHSTWMEDNGEGESGRVWDIDGHPLFLHAAGYDPDTNVDYEAYDEENDAYEAYYNKVGVYASKDNDGVCLYSLNFDKDNVRFSDNMPIEDGFRYSVRLFHKLEGNLPRPTIEQHQEGSCGMYYGQEAIIVNIGGKLMAMATKNLGADRPSDFGSYYTASEAEAAASALGNDWRLPTDTELKALSDTYSPAIINSKGVWATQNGVPGWQINFDNGNTLFFPRAGYLSDGSLKCEGEEAFYCAKGEGGNNGKYLNIWQNATIMTETLSSHKVSVRLIRNLDLNSSDPVGTIDNLDGRMGIVVDLGSTYGKVAIALQNEGATTITDAGSFYTWAEAKNLQSDGWYLPTKEELMALHAMYKNNLNFGSEGTGATWAIGGNSLYMPYAGYITSLGSQIALNVEYSCWTSSYTNGKGKKPYVFYIGHTLQDVKTAQISEIFEATKSKRNVRLFHKLQ